MGGYVQKGVCGMSMGMPPAGHGIQQDSIGKRAVLILLECFFVLTISTLDPTYNELKDERETARCKRVLVVTELFNIGINDFDTKKSNH